MDAETTGLVVSYGPIVFMVVLFYFLLYKPQKKEQKRRIGNAGNTEKGQPGVDAWRYLWRNYSDS